MSILADFNYFLLYYLMSLVYAIKDLADLEEKLQEAGSKLVVVQFSASWCGVCRMMGGTINDLARDNSEVVFLKVDVEECEEVALKYGVSVLPAFAFLKNSEKVDFFVGSKEGNVEEIMKKHK